MVHNGSQVHSLQERREVIFWREDPDCSVGRGMRQSHLPSHWLGLLLHFICLSSDWIRTLGEWSSLWLREEMVERRP